MTEPIFPEKPRDRDIRESLDVTIPRDQLDPDGRMPPHRLLVAMGLVDTTANGRRVIEQGGACILTLIADPKAPIDVLDGMVVQVGKHKVARVRLED